MERIHKKSILPETSTLLLAARDLGVDLLWGRYEQQLPLCAFTGNGLNCRKCFQGPCRINPFGDEPSRGICGADRDQIAMENLFQATLEGVMESARAARLLGAGDASEDFPDLAKALSPQTAERLAKVGVLPIRSRDLFGVQNSFFSHKAYLTETLKDLVRLGLIHHGFLLQAAALTSRDSGRPSFHSEGMNLLIVGQAPAELVRAIQASERTGGKPINLFSQGANRLPSTLAAADHGSPELALGMNVDALIVAADASWPAVEALAAKYGIPVVLAHGKSWAAVAAEAIDQGGRHAQISGPSAQTIQPGSTGGASSLPGPQEVRRALAAGRIAGVMVVYGEANVKQTFFERTLALMESAIVERALILLGGDLGSQVDALGAELGRRRSGELTALSKELAKDGLRPIAPFSAFELPSVVSLLDAVRVASDTHPTPVVASFPEFFRASTWAGAVSLLSLGFTVQVGIRLPFWGSPWLAQAMQTEWQKITGGRLLVAPALPEPRAQAEELAACLRAGQGR